MVSRYFTKLLRSRYGNAIATLSAGQSVAAAIPLLAAPILGRLYRPEEYGMLALYIAFAGVFAGASTLQYQNGILAVNSQRESDALAGLSILSSFGIALLTMVVAIGVWAYLRQDPAYGTELRWLFLLPLSTLSSGLMLSGEVVLNRRQKYRDLAHLQVVAVASSVAVTIALGVAGWGTNGVMAGYVTGEFIRTAGYGLALRRLNVRPFSVGRRAIWKIARRHRDYPKFTLPAMLMASTGLQMPVFALSWLGATVLLGSFSRAQRFVAMPFLLIGTAIGQAFRQKAAHEWRSTGSCRRTYLITAAMLAAMSTPPLILIFLFGPQIFAFILGPNWTIAGEVARILAPMLLLRTIASPLEIILHFAGHQRTAFRLNVLFLLLISSGTLGAALLTNDPMKVIWGFALAGSIVYLTSLAFSWRCTISGPASQI